MEQAPLVLPLPKRKKNSGRVGLRSGGRAPPAKELPTIKRPSSGRPSLQAREKAKQMEESASESESEDEKPLAKKSKPAPKVEKKLPVKKPLDLVNSNFFCSNFKVFYHLQITILILHQDHILINSNLINRLPRKDSSWPNRLSRKRQGCIPEARRRLLQAKSKSRKESQPQIQLLKGEINQLKFTFYNPKISTD